MTRWISTMGDVVESHVTLPTVTLPDTEEAELREIHQSFSEKRVIKSGKEALDLITTANTLSNWKRIGAALLIGKQFALRTTGANRAAGKTYTHAFHKWIVAHGFQRMRKSDRSHAIELAENVDAIDAWRLTLSEKRRQRLRSAQAVTKAWKKAIYPPNHPGPRADSPLKAAEVAWRHFCITVQRIPPNQSAPYWQRIEKCVAAIGQ